MFASYFNVVFFHEFDFVFCLCFVVIKLKGDKAVVSTRESTGDVTVELDVTNNVDYDFQIALNSSYLIEALKSLREEVVMLEFISKISPIIIREGNALELVLPVNMR